LCGTLPLSPGALRALLCTQVSITSKGICHHHHDKLQLAMETGPSQAIQPKRKRSGQVLRFEPQNLDLFEGNPNFIDSFRQVGCYRFCEKMQGYHKQMSMDFALNFDGIKTKVGPLEVAVNPDSISAATEIPRVGEKWFKVQRFKLANCDDFLVVEHKGADLSDGVPKSWLEKPYQQFLKIIQRFFTCEGRYDTVRQYHFRLLLHFTGREMLDIPFYLYRSLGKMSDKIQKLPQAAEKHLFHFGLMKLLVLEELRRLGRDWNTLLLLADYQLETLETPSRRRTPKPKSIVTPSQQETSDAIDSPSPIQTSLSRKGKKKVGEKTVVINEPSETRRQEAEQEEADIQILEHEGTPSHIKKTARKKLEMPQEQLFSSTARRPFTRSRARQSSEIEQAAIEAMVQLKECSPPEATQESDKQSMNLTQMRTQLRESQETIAQLQEENQKCREGANEIITLHEDTVIKTRKMLRRRLPLHYQVRNLYKQNRALQAQNRSLKEELQQVKAMLPKKKLASLTKATGLKKK